MMLRRSAVPSTVSLVDAGAPSSPDIDVRPLVYVFTRMHPDLNEPFLTGESWDDMRARRAAAADILDDLLAEAAEVLTATDADATQTEVGR
jgi:hypothetical protein